MKQKKVAIIILTCNQKKLLEETLESLIKKTDYKNYKIFLVDNGSEDRHDLMVKKKFKKVDVTRNKKNLGYSKGNNVGIKKALKTYKPDYFVLLNDDIEIYDGDWLKKIIDVAESDEKIGLVQCQIIYPDGSFQDVGGYFKKWRLTKISKFKKNEVLDVDHLDMISTLVKKEVVKKIGGFDEDFTPFLLDDSDYSLRAKKAGYSLKVVTGSKMIHKRCKTTGAFKNKKNLLIRFKNDILFSRKHMKGAYKFFRIFIYLPLVAIFKKKKDTGNLELKNFEVRKDFSTNLYYYVIAFFPRSYKNIIEDYR